MSNSTVAKRYALALFEIAKEQNQLEAIEEELRVVKSVFTQNKELNILLSNPKLSLDKKKGLIKEAFSSASLPVLNTLLLLTDRHRINQVEGVANEFIELSNAERGIAEATVYSVRPLTEDEREAVSASFANKVGKQSLRIENVTDENLLGGLKVQIGNRIFDGSLSGKLHRLERELVR
ncbi:F0F1 ATP synthase subunit delta [Rossellomorea oryzaecorticis]|uniref:ATP synthase subunit delta n=1 Tax=Rossellomorea oryzaecorticis TaxID=1396505 RepID=A0ABU9K4P0_9BACI